MSKLYPGREIFIIIIGEGEADEQGRSDNDAVKARNGWNRNTASGELKKKIKCKSECHISFLNSSYSKDITAQNNIQSLDFMRKNALAGYVKPLLYSAMSNAENNHNLDNKR